MPSIDTIKSLPREKTLKLVFKGPAQQQRKEIGENLIK